MASTDATPQRSDESDREYDRRVNEANEAWWESPQSDPDHIAIEDKRWAQRRPR